MGLDSFDATTWRGTLVSRALTSEDGPLTPEAAKVEKDTRDAVKAKTSLAASSGQPVAVAASVVSSVESQDAIQASADVLKLSAATVAKDTPAAGNLAVSGQIITSLNKAAQGDSFAAASAASAAVEKLSPALAASSVGAVASAIVLSTGDGKLAEQARKVKTDAKKVVAPRTSFSQRVRAAFDLTTSLQGFATVGRSLANAVVALGKFGLAHAAKVEELAPAAAKTQASLLKAAASPGGRLLAKVNRWIPMLNVAGVALSGKAAIDVFRNKRSSHTSKVLSLLSIATAGAALFAGFSLGGLPFVGIVAASVASDFTLAASRKRDLATGDSDAWAMHYVTHPHEAAWDAVQIVGKGIESLGASLIKSLGKIAHRMMPGEARAKTAWADRPLA